MVLSIQSVDWKELKQKILRHESFVDKYRDECKQIALGKVSDLTPSGKHRNFGRPARNLMPQGSFKGYVKAPELLIRRINKAEQEDNDWWKDLLDEGKKHGIYIRPSSDKQRTFIMAGMKIKDRSET